MLVSNFSFATFHNADDDEADVKVCGGMLFLILFSDISDNMLR